LRISFTDEVTPEEDEDEEDDEEASVDSAE
jgi:hypothetical protein